MNELDSSASPSADGIVEFVSAIRLINHPGLEDSATPPSEGGELFVGGCESKMEMGERKSAVLISRAVVNKK